MTIRFLVLAAMMVIAALACVLLPLLRSARREGHPHAPFWLALALVLATPPAVFGAYLAVGTPQALRPPPATVPADLANAAQQLRASLDAHPEDARGWALLAQAYAALNEPRQALDALQHALRLRPDDPDVMVAYVEAAAEADASHRIDAAARKLLERALTLNPTHQRALWLLGISDFQLQDYAGAVQQWSTLLPLLPAGSSVAAAVQQELAAAKARLGGGAPAATAASPAVATATALNVTVRLAPALANQLRPGDALFVYAKAVNGPPQPLAVARLHPSRIPVEVTLTDAMAMTPGVELAKYPRVLVAARISHSGDALPRPGDLESAPVEVATDSKAPIALTIDRVQ